MVGFNENREIVIHINGKERTLKEIINVINDIIKICENNCAYCKKNNISTDKEKLKLIRDIIKKRVGL